MFVVLVLSNNSSLLVTVMLLLLKLHVEHEGMFFCCISFQQIGHGMYCFEKGSEM